MHPLHQEIHFETAICAALAAQCWLYATGDTAEGDAAGHDRANALFLPDLRASFEAPQPNSPQKLTKGHGVGCNQMQAQRLRKPLDERGTLEVLRRGVDMLGLRKPQEVAQFKPALLQRYGANRLQVMHQVRQSVNQSQDTVGLVLFLNGIPVATHFLPFNRGNGGGQRYLIQHSAGSGKTNSIAWAAHFLADLHDAQHQKIFDSVLMVSDRTVLDAQLQEAIFD